MFIRHLQLVMWIDNACKYQVPTNKEPDYVSGIIEVLNLKEREAAPLWWSTSALKVRKEPNKSAGVITTLPLGTKILELEKTSEMLTIDGKTAPWFKVMTAIGQEGYVFSGYLTKDIKSIKKKFILKEIPKK